MRLLRDNILVERVKPETNPNSTIVIPQMVLDDLNTGGPKEFRVLAVGPGRSNKKGLTVPLECVPGDRIICQSWTTGPVEASPGKFVISADMILAVIPIR